MGARLGAFYSLYLEAREARGFMFSISRVRERFGALYSLFREEREARGSILSISRGRENLWGSLFSLSKGKRDSGLSIVFKGENGSGLFVRPP